MTSFVTKRWVVSPELAPNVDQELKRFSPILRQILNNRGCDTVEKATRYIQALPPEFSQPQNMLGVVEAVERISQAIQDLEPMAVYGDYDADGVTATALLSDVISRLGGQVRGYIPNRFEEGYGLNVEAIDHLAQDGVRLIITVDCGARSVEEAEYAHSRGVDLIITDHHQPNDQLPKAIALIDPKQDRDPYPDKNLAGVGLAYKLASALLEKASEGSSNPVYPSLAVDYLDLVAVGTITDQAPLIGENRSLVRTGLEYVRGGYRQGIRSLIGAAQINPNTINADTIGFTLGPRLNAAGRLDSAVAALDLLLTRDVQQAGRLAQLLDVQNRERQEITRDIQAHAEEVALASDPDSILLFAASAEYSPGVIGLVASKLMEKYYRPAIVAHQGEEFTRGSCRSIPEFHITKALDQCADLLVRHGGHSGAAGFTVRNHNLPVLIERLKLLALEQLSRADLRPSLRADAIVQLAELTPGLRKELNALEPTGNGNPAASFISRGVRVLRSRTVGRDNSHLKLTVTDGKITYDAIAFRMGEINPELPPYIDILFNFETNYFNGIETLQLNVKDIHPADGQFQLF